MADDAPVNPPVITENAEAPAAPAVSDPPATAAPAEAGEAADNGKEAHAEPSVTGKPAHVCFLTSFLGSLGLPSRQCYRFQRVVT